MNAAALSGINDGRQSRVGRGLNLSKLMKFLELRDGDYGHVP